MPYELQHADTFINKNKKNIYGSDTLYAYDIFLWFH